MNLENHNEEQGAKSHDRYFKVLEYLTEVTAWLVIVISLSSFSGLVAFLIHLFIPGNLGITIAWLFFIAGIISSIVYAIYVWRKKGTVNFISNSSWRYNDTGRRVK